MSRQDLVEALVAQCLKDIGNKEQKVFDKEAAEWFLRNVNDGVSHDEWSVLLMAFRDNLRERGAII